MNITYITVYKNNKVYAYFKYLDNGLIEGVLKNGTKLLGGKRFLKYTESNIYESWNCIVFENNKEHMDALSISYNNEKDLFLLYDAVLGNDLISMAVNPTGAKIKFEFVSDNDTKKIEAIDNMINIATSSLEEETLKKYNNLMGFNLQNKKRKKKKKLDI